MSVEERMKHLDFIEVDTKEKGEEIISNITFFSCIYSLKISINGKKKRIRYSAAGNVLKGYRKIN